MIKSLLFIVAFTKLVAVGANTSNYDPQKSVFQSLVGSHNIHLDASATELTKVIDARQELVLLLVTNQEAEAKSAEFKRLNTMFKRIIGDFEGYITTYIFDCGNFGNWPNDVMDWNHVCNKESYSPTFRLIVPPRSEVHPWTGEKTKSEIISYPSPTIQQHELKQWILINIPAFTTQLRTIEDWNEFVAEDDINKLVLFTDKSMVPPTFNALTNQRHNKLRFGFVMMNEESQQLIDFLAEEMPEKPALYAIQNKDYTLLKQRKKAVTFDKPNIVKFEGEAKLNTLSEFAAQYERVHAKKDDYLISSKKKELKSQYFRGNYMEIEADELQAEVYDSQQGCLVYFVDAVNMNREQYQTTYLMDTVGTKHFGAIKTLVVHVHGGSAELKNLIGMYSLPQLRYYPNEFTGDQKKAESFEIFLSNESFGENVDLVTQMIQSHFNHQVKEINEDYLNELAEKYSNDYHQSLIFYLYDDNKGIDVNFLAMSVDPWMQDDFAFAAIHNPSDKLRNNGPLPTVAGALRDTTADSPSHIIRINGLQGISFVDLRKVFMELSDKYETFLEHIDDEMKYRREHIKFMKESIFDQEIILF